MKLTSAFVTICECTIFVYYHYSIYSIFVIISSNTLQICKIIKKLKTSIYSYLLFRSVIKLNRGSLNFPNHTQTLISPWAKSNITQLVHNDDTISGYVFVAFCSLWRYVIQAHPNNGALLSFTTKARFAARLLKNELRIVLRIHLNENDKSTRINWLFNCLPWKLWSTGYKILINVDGNDSFAFVFVCYTGLK